MEQPLQAGRVGEAAERLAAVLDGHGMAVGEVLVHELASGTAVCVVAGKRPSAP